MVVTELVLKNTLKKILLCKSLISRGHVRSCDCVSREKLAIMGPVSTYQFSMETIMPIVFQFAWDTKRDEMNY